jgi:hypothetical protein
MHMHERNEEHCMARPKSTPIEPVTPAKKAPPVGTGSAAAGQSGDLQGLPGKEDVENESVRELQEEGQFFEASVVDGVENAAFAEEGEVRVRQRPEDDLPPEYAAQAPDEPKE